MTDLKGNKTCFDPSKWNSSKIQSISTQSVAVSFTAVGELNYTLNAPFIPDMVEVSAYMYNIDDGTGNNVLIGPFYSEIAGVASLDFINSNIFEIRSNVLPNFNIICNATNTVNPVYQFTNNSRQNFQGSYSVNAYNLTNNTQIAQGGIVLIFKYIRYE